MKACELMDKDLTAIFCQDNIERFLMVCQRSGYSALPVVDENYKLIGYLSESTVIKISLPGYLSMMENSAFIPDSTQFIKGLKKVLDHPVSEFISGKPFKVYVDDTAMHVADLMIRNKLKMIPVVDKTNTLVGKIRRITLLWRSAKGDID
ncbi:MAG TPA: CBS domain-containing protein [Petrotogaceae bacterium]|jgi:CBS domain-containing protein|nr:CBS domain-containing protein [Petrotogaceae bacterium]HNY36677.1 CBS domain-containing protein [Petrotogaceae bacterium]HOG34032.1 CBS domain-containing protein [Petrotogaceae bacterium]HOT32505.1 CBS domain-containing protein [Petrotogaceae bacterium]HPO27171.1 CBS domain-containing protein [Petrotogaceae bacterium]